MLVALANQVRDELALLDHEARRGLLTCGAVDADTGRLVEPLHRLEIEIVEALKRPAQQEVAFHVAEGILDLPLALRVAGSERDSAVAVVDHHTLEDRVEEHAVLVTLQHDLLHPVIEDLARYST